MKKSNPKMGMKLQCKPKIWQNENYFKPHYHHVKQINKMVWKVEWKKAGWEGKSEWNTEVHPQIIIIS